MQMLEYIDCAELGTYARIYEIALSDGKRSFQGVLGNRQVATIVLLAPFLAFFRPFPFRVNELAFRTGIIYGFIHEEIWLRGIINFWLRTPLIFP